MRSKEIWANGNAVAQKNRESLDAPGLLDEFDEFRAFAEGVAALGGLGEREDQIVGGVGFVGGILEEQPEGGDGGGEVEILRG